MKQIKIMCSYTRMVSVKELRTKKHPRNPNSHPKDQVVMLAGIIENTGWRAPIVISNLSGLMTRGHGRLEAAEYLKLKECPVDFQDYSSTEEEIADMIADNKVQSMSILDEIECAKLVQDCINTCNSFDITLSGFNPSEINTLLFVSPVAPLQTGKPKSEFKSEETQNTSSNNDQYVENKRPKGKPTFKCPNCGFEDV